MTQQRDADCLVALCAGHPTRGRFGLQGVDVTLEGANGQLWAQQSSLTSTVVSAPVTDGEDMQIVLWYTFPKLEYVLTTTLAP